MRPYNEEYIIKMRREREQRKAEFEDQLINVWQLMVTNVNPMRKPRWTVNELIPFFNYHLRTPFFALLDRYRMIRGEYIIELVDVRTYRLRVHYYQSSPIPTEIVILAKRPSRAETANRLLHTMKDSLKNKILNDNPFIPFI